MESTQYFFVGELAIPGWLADESRVSSKTAHVALVLLFANTGTVSERIKDGYVFKVRSKILVVFFNWVARSISLGGWHVVVPG